MWCLLFAAPSGPPTSVSTTNTSTTITVQWEAVACIHHNGDITGYSVQYMVVGSDTTWTMSVSGGSITEATISSLMSSATYSIRVAAVNSAGTGVYSDYLIVHAESKCTADSTVSVVNAQFYLHLSCDYVTDTIHGMFMYMQVHV